MSYNFILVIPIFAGMKCYELIWLRVNKKPSEDLSFDGLLLLLN
ncbi:hypothetical protein [Flavivirga sp. 57AJ16]|nr:hypothetical protein [Flavivirga sp. 57AJ16]MDD7885665.1 hypothetical protein [Flavivirga sp. 57AJ16]